MLRALWFLMAFGGALAAAQGDRPPGSRLHISPSDGGGLRSSIKIENDRWIARDTTLRAALATAYGVEKDRVELPPALDTGQRYDIELLLPEPDPDGVSRRAQQALENHFHLAISHQNRLRDVYVMTAPNGASPAMQPALEDSEIESETRVASHKVEARAATMSMLARTLERELGRPVVDETHLAGHYSFVIQGDDAEPVRQLLRDRLGLVLAPAERPVETLVVRQVR